MFWQIEHHQRSAIMFHYIWEKADISRYLLNATTHTKTIYCFLGELPFKTIPHPYVMWVDLQM